VADDEFTYAFFVTEIYIENPSEYLTLGIAIDMSPRRIGGASLNLHPMIISLAGSILALESLLADNRPLKVSQGNALDRIFTLVLVFPNLGVNAEHICGVLITKADLLSRVRIRDNDSTFNRRFWIPNVLALASP